MRRTATGLLLLAMLAGTARAATVSAIAGQLTKAQTGAADSTDRVNADAAGVLALEVQITGTCTVTVKQCLRSALLSPATGNYATSCDVIVGVSTITTTSVLNITNPVGDYLISTSSCTGSATVNYEQLRKGNP